MALKHYFNGVSLLTVEVPDAPLPSVLAQNSDHLAPLNPQGADPALLPVDVANLPDLRPTDGAVPTGKFHEPLPGSGEGPGVGQKSGAALRDVWANNPNRTVAVETLQSGPIGSALVGREAAAAAVTQAKLQDAWTADRPTAEDRRAADHARRYGIEQPVGQVGTVHAPVPEAEVVRATDDREIGGEGGGSEQTPGPAATEGPDESWTKAQLAAYIGENVENPSEVPESTELKAVFIEKAQAIHNAKSLA